MAGSGTSTINQILRCAQNDPAPNYGKSLFGTGQAAKWIPDFAGMTATNIESAPSEAGPDLYGIEQGIKNAEAKDVVRA